MSKPYAERLAALSPEALAEHYARERVRDRARRASETEAQAAARQARQRAAYARRTPAQRERRNANARAAYARRREAETPLGRDLRLTRARTERTARREAAQAAAQAAAGYAAARPGNTDLGAAGEQPETGGQVLSDYDRARRRQRHQARRAAR